MNLGFILPLIQKKRPDHEFRLERHSLQLPVLRHAPHGAGRVCWRHGTVPPLRHDHHVSRSDSCLSGTRSFLAPGAERGLASATTTSRCSDRTCLSTRASGLRPPADHAAGFAPNDLAATASAACTRATRSRFPQSLLGGLQSFTSQHCACFR
jgi:hypothetical protein